MTKIVSILALCAVSALAQDKAKTPAPAPVAVASPKPFSAAEQLDVARAQIREMQAEIASLEKENDAMKAEMEATQERIRYQAMVASQRASHQAASNCAPDGSQAWNCSAVQGASHK